MPSPVQANIVALNAVVEDARAGKAGRNFAVVTSEARSLAQRSAAAREIKDLIANSVGRVEAAPPWCSRRGTACGRWSSRLATSLP